MRAAGLFLIVVGLFTAVNRGLAYRDGVDLDPLAGAALSVAGVLLLMMFSGRRRGLRF